MLNSFIIKLLSPKNSHFSFKAPLEATEGFSLPVSEVEKLASL